MHARLLTVRALVCTITRAALDHPAIRQGTALSLLVAYFGGAEFWLTEVRIGTRRDAVCFRSVRTPRPSGAQSGLRATELGGRLLRRTRRRYLLVTRHRNFNGRA